MKPRSLSPRRRSGRPGKPACRPFPSGRARSTESPFGLDGEVLAAPRPGCRRTTLPRGSGPWTMMRSPGTAALDRLADRFVPLSLADPQRRTGRPAAACRSGRWAASYRARRPRWRRRASAPRTTTATMATTTMISRLRSSSSPARFLALSSRRVEEGPALRLRRGGVSALGGDFVGVGGQLLPRLRPRPPRPCGLAVWGRLLRWGDGDGSAAGRRVGRVRPGRLRARQPARSATCGLLAGAGSSGGATAAATRRVGTCQLLRCPDDGAPDEIVGTETDEPPPRPTVRPSAAGLRRGISVVGRRVDGRLGRTAPGPRPPPAASAAAGPDPWPSCAR